MSPRTDMEGLEPCAAPNGMLERLELVFPKPIQFAGEVYAKAMLREPTGADILATRQAPVLDREEVLFHRVSGLPKGVVGQIGIRQLTQGDVWMWRWSSEEGMPNDGLPDALSFPLRQQVTHGAETYSSVTLHEPTGAQMREIRARDEREQVIAGVSVIGGIPEAAVRKIGIRDLVRAEAYLVGFINAGQKAGVA